MCGRPLAFRQLRYQVWASPNLRGIAPRGYGIDGRAERFRTSGGKAASSLSDFYAKALGAAMGPQTRYVARAYDLVLAVSGFNSQRAVTFKSTRGADQLFVTQRHANHSAKRIGRVCTPLAD